MAISSINHKSIGKSTHPPRTASAHLRYVLRASACNEVLAANMPMPTIGSRGGKAKAWLEEHEDKSRKNARIIDKLMIALPIELSQEQRVEMLHAYVAEITGGEEISWLAALHDQDSHNPHVHMIFRDKGLNTGKRVVEFSEKGSTQRLRESWQKICNEHLAKAGFDARIDTRSLKVQREELLAKAEEATDPEERQKLLDAAEKLNRRPSGHEGPEPHAIESSGDVSTKLERLRKIRNEDNVWENYKSDAEFLRYPSAEAIGDLIVDVLDQPEEHQPIAETDQVAADWWDRTFEHEEAYCGFVALLSASHKTTDMPSLLAEADKLFEDINTHREHPLIKELDHLAILGRATLQGGWRALPQLTEAMRSYATELAPLPFADALELDLAHHAVDAFEADQERLDAAEDLLAAERNLSKVKQNLRNAQDILDGKYDLITGELKQSKEKSTFKLQDQSETSDEDARHEEHVAMWYDEDGDEIFPSPRPSLTDYNDARTRQRDFDDHFAEWLVGEAARIARAEKNKRRIWEAEFQEKRDQLRAINKLDVGQIIGDVLKLARSIFDWLRDRVVLARNILGEKHDLTKQMKADWGETLAENKKTYDVVVADHQQQKRVADSTAQNTWEHSKTAWAEVEQKREELRKARAAQQTKSRDSGPSM